MLLSDAIKYGSTLRCEGRSGPFTRVANSDELLSDVWGAACEAVHSLVAKRNWNDDTRGSDIEYLRGIQEKYFGDYFRMPALCPGAQPRVIAHTRGRFSGRVVGGLNELVIGRETYQPIQGITNVCAHVSNLAELVEHVFYIHNWTREECAQYVEWHEQQQTSLITQNFTHYQDNAVMKRTAQRLTVAAITRHQQRQHRKTIFPLQ
jgi:hypothetical protein